MRRYLAVTPYWIVMGLAASWSGAETPKRASTPAVFPPPSAEELSEVSLPKVRLDLLRMVHEDQVARRSGK